MKKNVFINGRFLTQPVTGVQRFAFELLKALDKNLINELKFVQTHNIICLVPNNIDDLLLPNWENITIQKCGKFAGNLWEQIELLFYSRNGLLVNLCNSGPFVHRNQIVVFHDASVYAFPKTYSFGFKMKYYLFMGILSHTAQKILTVSQFSKKELSRYLKIGEEKISVISEGCEHILQFIPDDSILNENDLLKSPYLFAVGSKSSQKNMSRVVEALEKSGDNLVPLVIAGGGFSKVFTNVKKLSQKRLFILATYLMSNYVLYIRMRSDLFSLHYMRGLDFLLLKQ